MIFVVYRYADAADGLTITIEVPFEEFLIASDGGKVVFVVIKLVPVGGVTEVDVIHQFEVRSFVTGSSINIRGKLVKITGSFDLVGVVEGTATVPRPCGSDRKAH